MHVHAPRAEEAAPVCPEPLDHPARPALALAYKVTQLHRRLGECDRGWLEHRPSAVADQCPGENDVFPDPVRPAAHTLDCACSIHAERPLRDERPLKERLLPLHGGDREEVVPFLYPGQPVRTRVAHEYGT